MSDSALIDILTYLLVIVNYINSKSDITIASHAVTTGVAIRVKIPYDCARRYKP
jgi:hypothetical protein